MYKIPSHLHEHVPFLNFRSSRKEEPDQLRKKSTYDPLFGQLMEVLKMLYLCVDGNKIESTLLKR